MTSCTSKLEALAAHSTGADKKAVERVLALLAPEIKHPTHF